MITSDRKLELELECAACQGSLEAASEWVRCPACGRRWPAAGGVITLGQASEFPQDFPAEQLQELLNIAESAGWQAALHDYMRPLDRARYRHAVDEYRAQWRCLLPSTPHARVLDFRCGWGPVTVSLAEEYGMVVAADTAPELARFTAMRAAAIGATNVRALCIDPRERLPFASGYFDTVILQSALEWGQPGRLLGEVARILAPGGCLFMSVSNRLNAARLLQAGQNWLRRQAAGARATGSERSQSEVRQPQLRSLNGYRRALAQAGFRGSAAHAILPSVEEPFYIVPLTNSGALQYFLDNLFNDASLHLALAERNLLGPYRIAQAAWRGLRRLPFEPVLGHFMPGYGLLATRQ